MAINKKDKPLRPDPTKANYKGTMGKNPVVKITKVTKPLKKAAVKNPSAPSAASPRGGGVRVITKSETFMKKDKARRDRTGIGRPQNSSAFKKSDAADKPQKPRTETQKLVDRTGVLNSKGYTQLKPGEKSAGNTKGGKPTKVTPKKKTPPAPKQKRRIFTGRGGSMRGGSMGGGMGFPGNVNQ